MAAGYIVVRKNTAGNVDAYWNGTAFIESTVANAIDSSDFIETQTDARFVQGSIQTQTINADVAYVAAESSVTIIP
ncbi:hypothetical protein [Anabaena lutea]|uniref:Uncharacterized protein n=1 Tax=Anabaena lutea FACHB-196 TaxID=2692881 RepID=A0ABR8FDS7_9NOST|nr:hypothetical protein [Anabaena lutea]MBD2568362.1 hypothetical protein [Anabaena lutea FACHB-196]